MPDVVAIVLTYRRPRLATAVVRALIDVEGFPPSRIVVVVNGEGGLTDPALEEEVQVLRLAENLGPAGGYLAGLRFVAEQTDAEWVYVCEDDIGLLDIPAPRVERLVERVERARDEDGRRDPIGAVVAYGRDLDARTGTTHPHTPSSGEGFDEVDVAAWGASLVSSAVVRAGVLPHAPLFFGFEDFDFWLQMKAAGFRLLLDNEASAAIGSAISERGREAVMVADRPISDQEPWRRYYEARNFITLRRRHGHLGWTMAHLVKSVRRAQLAGTADQRVAIVRGLADGFRGRLGRNARFTRSTGEWDTAPGADGG